MQTGAGPELVPELGFLSQSSRKEPVRTGDESSSSSSRPVAIQLDSPAGFTSTNTSAPPCHPVYIHPTSGGAGITMQVLSCLMHRDETAACSRATQSHCPLGVLYFSISITAGKSCVLCPVSVSCVLCPVSCVCVLCLCPVSVHHQYPKLHGAQLTGPVPWTRHVSHTAPRFSCCFFVRHQQTPSAVLRLSSPYTSEPPPVAQLGGGGALVNHPVSGL
ncbi:unnamed protein product [Pleuronectes platessa]|uniref:Uncharacterized protein n=1 Tax=Pleuronectes platessa TaxID=8262 RepID=A0A9N7Y1V8_PLEPL|nr:unnamed protein product [Pleuronectes platessa]